MTDNGDIQGLLNSGRRAMPVKSRSALRPKSRWIVLSVAAAILATAPFAAKSPANASAFSFTQIDVPGAQETQAMGINDAGQIVGFFIVGFFPTSVFHGFLRDTGGSFTQIDPPGSIFTLASGINNVGQIVGSFSNPDRHGFLDTGGSFTQIDVPFPAILTEASGINNAGQIVGDFFSTPSSAHGFSP
jgi:uncharacterized membrane protein